MTVKYNFISVFIALIFFSCMERRIAKEQVTEKLVENNTNLDRHIGIVNIDTLEFYINKSMEDVHIKKGKSTIRIYTTISRSNEFYKKILGQQLVGKNSISNILNKSNSIYKNKWRPIINDSADYGFESDIYEIDNKYAYVPFEILKQLNSNRKIK